MIYDDICMLVYEYRLLLHSVVQDTTNIAIQTDLADIEIQIHNRYMALKSVCPEIELKMEVVETLNEHKEDEIVKNIVEEAPKPQLFNPYNK